MPEALVTPILVDPAVAPDRIAVELVALAPDVPIRMTAPLEPVALRTVFSVPAPRKVQLLGTVRDPLMLYVPEASNTTLPDGQEESAAFNWASVAPAPAAVAAAQAEVAHTVVLLGIPPITPGAVQSIAREGFRIPDHACAWETVGTIRSRSADKRSNCL
jgi:hypothetical protein